MLISAGRLSLFFPLNALFFSASGSGMFLRVLFWESSGNDGSDLSLSSASC